MKNKLCKWISHKNFDILKLQPNKATLRSDPTQAVKIYGEEQRIVAAFLFTSIFQADKPREFEGRALNSRQAANLSSKKIANCEYASPQSRTGMVHFLDISFTLIKMTFLIESSVGNTALDLVNFLTILW